MSLAGSGHGVATMIATDGQTWFIITPVREEGGLLKEITCASADVRTSQDLANLLQFLLLKNLMAGVSTRSPSASFAAPASIESPKRRKLMPYASVNPERRLKSRGDHLESFISGIANLSHYELPGKSVSITKMSDAPQGRAEEANGLIC